MSDKDPKIGGEKPLQGNTPVLDSSISYPMASSRSSMIDSASEISESEASMSGVSQVSELKGSRFLTTQVTQANLIDTVQELKCRLNVIGQEYKVKNCELQAEKLRNKKLTEENKRLRQAGVNIQARAEMEEELISNTLLKKINELKREKETLVNDYENEEEFLTNDLSRKLIDLRNEKAELQRKLDSEQQMQVAKLMRRIERMEREMQNKQETLETLRREKVDLEQTLEQEQEALVNKLWKRMDKLENEKRQLQERLNQPVSSPPSPPPEGNPFTKRSGNIGGISGLRDEDTDKMATHIRILKKEIEQLKRQLRNNHTENEQRMEKMCAEERILRDQNRKLHERLELEKIRSDSLCRALSESESSLDGSFHMEYDRWDTMSNSDLKDRDYLNFYPKARAETRSLNTVSPLHDRSGSAVTPTLRSPHHSISSGTSMPVNQIATKQQIVNRQVQRSLTGSAFSPHKEKKDDSVAEKYAPSSHNKNNTETGSLSGRSVDSRYMNDSASIVSESAAEIGEILFDKKKKEEKPKKSSKKQPNWPEKFNPVNFVKPSPPASPSTSNSGFRLRTPSPAVIEKQK